MWEEKIVVNNRRGYNRQNSKFENVVPLPEELHFYPDQA